MAAGSLRLFADREPRGLIQNNCSGCKHSSNLVEVRDCGQGWGRVGVDRLSGNVQGKSVEQMSELGLCLAVIFLSGT